MFLVELFTTSRAWAQHNYPTTDDWIKEIRLEYCLVIKRNETVHLQRGRWAKSLSYRVKSERQILYIKVYMWNLEKWYRYFTHGNVYMSTLLSQFALSSFSPTGPPCLHLIPLGLPSAPGLSTCLMHPTWAGDLFHPR